MHRQQLKKIFEKVTNKKAKFKSTTGGSDTRFFAGKGIITADFGVVGKNLHALNEWADIKSMETVYKILKEFIKTL